ncbi:hypothetical protein KCU81_g232, partial [Aureobasidium melanogenum]
LTPRLVESVIYAIGGFKDVARLRMHGDLKDICEDAVMSWSVQIPDCVKRSATWIDDRVRLWKNALSSRVVQTCRDVCQDCVFLYTVLEGDSTKTLSRNSKNLGQGSRRMHMVARRSVAWNYTQASKRSTAIDMVAGSTKLIKEKMNMVVEQKKATVPRDVKEFSLGV